jgi:hypothetical protein
MESFKRDSLPDLPALQDLLFEIGREHGSRAKLASILEERRELERTLLTTTLLTPPSDSTPPAPTSPLDPPSDLASEPMQA